ncbi:MAG: tyrosine-type recombinase/integrase [Streptosporangiales bacterium]|nr:tyrosine-type recombinase/integrase [Streptosporangiales bacterium]
MAFIETRKTKGGRKRYRVWWRLGGSRYGEPQSETFDALAEARDFKAAVEVAGHQWPPGYVKGVGWVADQPDEPDQPEEDPRAPEEPVLFRDYALAYVRGLSGVDDRTRHDYERDLRRHLLPVFGDLDIRDGTALCPALVRRWVNDLQAGQPDPDDPKRWRRRPLRPKTIQNLHGLLFTALQDAVNADPPLRASNPAAGTRLPRLDDDEGDEEMVFLTRAEFALLRSCAQPDVRDMLTVFVGTGLRYAELVALQVRDLDLDATPPRLRVRRGWKRQADNTFALGAPKTKQSRRTITLSAEVAAVLKPYVSGKEPTEFVFTTAQGFWWRHTNFYHRRWLPAVKAARDKGLAKRPRIHDLRHTHVSWLIAAQVPLPAIQRRLGHTSITTTIDRYGHLLPEVDLDLLAAIDRALGDDPPAA